MSFYDDAEYLTAGLEKEAAPMSFKGPIPKIWSLAQDESGESVVVRAEDPFEQLVRRVEDLKAEECELEQELRERAVEVADMQDALNAPVTARRKVAAAMPRMDFWMKQVYERAMKEGGRVMATNRHGVDHYLKEERAIQRLIERGYVGDDRMVLHPPRPPQKTTVTPPDIGAPVIKEPIMAKRAVIEHRDGKWLVKTKDGSKTLGTHDSEESAKKQLAAIEISKRGAYDGAGAIFPGESPAAMPEDEIASLEERVEQHCAEEDELRNLVEREAEETAGLIDLFQGKEGRRKVAAKAPGDMTGDDVFDAGVDWARRHPGEDPHAFAQQHGFGWTHYNRFIDGVKAGQEKMGAKKESPRGLTQDEKIYQYEYKLSKSPTKGQEVNTPHGPGKVVELMPDRGGDQWVRVELESGEVRPYGVNRLWLPEPKTASLDSGDLFDDAEPASPGLHAAALASRKDWV